MEGTAKEVIYLKYFDYVDPEPEDENGNGDDNGNGEEGMGGGEGAGDEGANGDDSGDNGGEQNTGM